ncbi:MAG TPA: kinase, partial [Paracoccus sp. (in: a-proteobacteria)]|nr:kinase [Paracoccus sp. (in: a-proteobacteria)]
PPAVPIARVTGAGDCFLAAHLAAERGGAGREQALAAAVSAAAAHVAGEDL